MSNLRIRLETEAFMPYEHPESNDEKVVDLPDAERVAYEWHDEQMAKFKADILDIIRRERDYASAFISSKELCELIYTAVKAHPTSAVD